MAAPAFDADAGGAPRFTAASLGLSAEQAAAFSRDGFVILTDFVEPWRCDALRQRAAELIEEFEPGTLRTIFSTREQSHAQSDYFLSSGDKIRFFFEAEAFDRDGRLIQPKAMAINKIGHALHDLDPLFHSFSRDVRLARIAADLGIEAPLLAQSMYICKQPLIGGEVDWHQDSTFLHTEPESVIGFWFALEDATIENGCMMALPGQHRGSLRRRFRRAAGGMTMEVVDPAPWPAIAPVALIAPQGSLVILHGRLPHASPANRSDRSRHAYALHVIDGAARYSQENWLQRGPGLPLRSF